MAISQAQTTTDHGASYIQRLCKHWSHRFPVELFEGAGRVDFGEQQLVSFQAETGALAITISVDDASRLSKLEEVVASHLQRFAHQETLVVAWVRHQEATS